MCFNLTSSLRSNLYLRCPALTYTYHLLTVVLQTSIPFRKSEAEVLINETVCEASPYPGDWPAYVIPPSPFLISDTARSLR